MNRIIPRKCPSPTPLSQAPLEKTTMLLAKVAEHFKSGKQDEIAKEFSTVIVGMLAIFMASRFVA
ncbi:hypothetical protein [Dyadobacter psychrophilus]|uniref:hypothetical protein n=1 Tax=Dyadobacter psychrophilus TaxID=651661 RepID=UPI0009E21485|nr:hypothetical protein [Dyadobacter psychrophilus]